MACGAAKCLTLEPADVALNESHAAVIIVYDHAQNYTFAS
jgi:hypothetical protein